MIIAVDEAIPYWQAAFAPLGEIKLFSGRALRRADLREVDALIVRTVTRVCADLLDGTPVRFVGTTSIGMDHLDLDYLERHGIRITNAAGSNANAVAEYIVAALLVLAERKGWDLRGKSIGIIGAGHVGSRVEKKASALGMQVRLCDPPLRESTGDPRYGFIDSVIDADILSLHVPLTTRGPYPTHHMIDHRILQRLTPQQFLVNSSRGAVVSGQDLKRTLGEGRIGGTVLDVWEGEPEIDYALLDLADLGTPHIAGFSLDGKVCGTAMVREELCRFLGVQQVWDSGKVFPPPQRLRPQTGRRAQDAIRSAVLQAYDIRRDDTILRASKEISGDAAAQGFDRLRTGYPLRPEFSHYIVELAEDTWLAPTLEALGFAVDASTH
jgi:erythronate-4-phosphate dehydrogenase